MNAYLSDLESRRGSFEPPPILIAGDGKIALARAARSIEASGMRIADQVLVETAPERIEQQASASALWVELDRDGGESMDRLLTLVNRDAAAGRYAAVVSARAELLDVLAARIDDSAVELIIDADDAERAAALAVALASRAQPLRVADAAAEQNAVRLRQLSDDVSRIASTLARLSAGPAATIRPAEALPSNVPEISSDTVRTVIRARRMRSRHFPEGLFADPAWDMLLDLLQAEIAQLRVPVSSLCIAAAVPATTALRWLKSMTSQGLFTRRADPHDGRRVFVELAPETSIALRCYFAEVGKVAVI